LRTVSVPPAATSSIDGSIANSLSVTGVPFAFVAASWASSLFDIAAPATASAQNASTTVSNVKITVASP
jgi:hypothetical protein